jgi:hypothetical protein
VRSAPGVYPAVTALCSLAADVRSVLGGSTEITYAADWTEYGAHVLDGGAEVRFPLDPLWAHPAIDAVGIDFYPPIADWRDGAEHADLAEARSAYDIDYLRWRVVAGEAFDWFYASEADRDAPRHAGAISARIALVRHRLLAVCLSCLIGWSRAHFPPLAQSGRALARRRLSAREMCHYGRKRSVGAAQECALVLRSARGRYVKSKRKACDRRPPLVNWRRKSGRTCSNWSGRLCTF